VADGPLKVLRVVDYFKNLSCNF